ncbi:hypothetical protein [Scytonema millei]|uniref:Uncharacterized protein n=1 Tax=Scytonema millei VB511283 TaxID=1245923 RepID=A0A9X5E565_9CYAN|nr:hypothetical protein [Scytonema millei]NHC34212.1 hypothetical protein [Scytonema millei VB511283]
MKLTSVLAGFALVGLVTVVDAPLRVINPRLGQASAQEMQMKGPTSIPIQKKIELITAHKGQLGGGDELRRYFFGDLLPVSVQPGGAGMVVLLYNKANDYTFAYCATYDVVVALKKGKVMKFEPSEVK